MRQISDVEIDDNIFIDHCSVITIFSKKFVWAINHKCNPREAFINKFKPTLTKESEIREIKLSNYNCAQERKSNYKLKWLDMHHEPKLGYNRSSHNQKILWKQIRTKIEIFDNIDLRWLCPKREFYLENRWNKEEHPMRIKYKRNIKL